MDEDVLAIQRLYPQVFHACHVAHSRRRTNAFRLSERDGAILAHLGVRDTGSEDAACPRLSSGPGGETQAKPGASSRLRRREQAEGAGAGRLAVPRPGLLGPDGSVTANELARHLGIGAPTLSAALQRLERLGYLARRPRSRSSPARPLHLTEQGRRALQATSVLDTGRLTELLATLPARDRRRAVQGLELLVRGARNVAVAAARNGDGVAS